MTMDHGSSKPASSRPHMRYRLAPAQAARRRGPMLGPEVAMDMSLISRVLWQRRVLRRRERWSQPRLAQHQRRQLAALRAFAAARSPFYQRFHKGLRHAPLGELPVLTKATLMDNFDQVS